MCAQNYSKYAGYCNVTYYDEDKNFLGTDLVQFIYLDKDYTYPGLFLTPATAHYMCFTTGSVTNPTYYNDICINLHWDGERDGEYEPYNDQFYPCDDIELKGIPMIDGEGNLYFDGDKYWHNGTVDEEYMIVDGGDLDYQYNATVQAFTSTSLMSLIEPCPSQSTMPKMSVEGYNVMKANQVLAENYPDRSCYLYQDNFGIANKAYTDAVAFKAAMAGVKIVIKKRTSTQIEATPFEEQQDSDNWGTEEWVDAHSGSDVVMLVGHNTDYLPDLKAKVESAPDNPDNDGDYIMHREDDENSYTPLGAWLVDNGYVKASDVGSTYKNATFYMQSDNDSGNKYFFSWSWVTDKTNFTSFEDFLSFIYTQANYNERLVACNGIIIIGSTVYRPVEFRPVGGNPIGYNIRCIQDDGNRTNLTRTQITFSSSSFGSSYASIGKDY